MATRLGLSVLGQPPSGLLRPPRQHLDQPQVVGDRRGERRREGTPRRQGRRYGMTGPEAVIRNMVMRQLGGQRLLARYDWLFGFEAPQFDFADRHVTQIGGDEAEGA